MCRSSLLFVLLIGATMSGRVLAQDSGAHVLLNVFTDSADAPTTLTETATLPLTADALLGPPNPATMYALTGVTEVQLAQYLAAYRAHMAATWNMRVSTMSALNMMDRAYQNSDAQRVEYYRSVLDQLWSRLRTDDRGFDVALGSILNRKQLERFRAWRAAWERGSREQQRLQVSFVENPAQVR